MKKLSFFLFFWGSFLPSWIRIRNLYADPDPTAQINADPDPDPKPWFSELYVSLLYLVVFHAQNLTFCALSKYQAKLLHQI
jgi:hypothetical protein